MSFELAAIIILALLAVLLGLVCYHLLGRLDMLERAVQGGLGAPSTRLSREQFEQRFKIAHARSTIANEVGTGLLLIVGAEHSPQSELSRTLSQLSRPDLVTIQNFSEVDASNLGITTTPYLFIVDEAHIRNARPLSSPTEIISALQDFA